MTERVLEVDRLKTHFFTRDGVVRAVDSVSINVERGETLGIVGESGCGKSVTGLSIMRLIPTPPGRFVDGAIRFQGTDLLELSEREMRRIRGKEISMIFQEPMTSLNPVLSIGWQMSEAFILHRGLSRRQAIECSIEMLRTVHIADADRRIKQYPHELSGGMRQRVMIAMALSCSPKVLIADEPTTALDVTIQAQILDLMQELKSGSNTAIVLITHDLGVIAKTAKRVVVMYAGRQVEEATVEDLFEHPLHPYTVGLLGAVPRLGSSQKASIGRLTEIPGMVPPLNELPAGCVFYSRCRFAGEYCRTHSPSFEERRANHRVACWKWAEVEAEGHGTTH